MKRPRLRTGWLSMAFTGLLPAAAILAGGQQASSPSQSQEGHRWVSLDPLESEPPLKIGQRRQLLADNHVLCDWSRVRRVQEKVRKHNRNPILEADQPWEQEAREGFGVSVTSVAYDGGTYRLWYEMIGKRNRVMGFATSRDGIRWAKPDLGLVEYAGTKRNNLCRLEPAGVPLRGQISLIQDPQSRPPGSRYLAIGVAPCHGDGTLYGGWMSIAASADGITWRLIQSGLRAGAGGGSPSCLWDEQLGRYVLFHRQLTERAATEGLKRYIVRQESTDLKRWSPRQTAVNPTDPEWPEVESMMVFRHEGIYFGLANMLDSEIRGEVELHLWMSRDGRRWEQPFPREAFIPRGPRGDFDDMITWFGLAVIQADEMKFYYTGTRYPHSKPRSPIADDGGSLTFTETTPSAAGMGRVEYRSNKVGLAVAPLDRLVGLRADEPVGAFLTRPLLVEGDELYVNANVDRELRVEVVNPETLQEDTGPKGGVMGHYIAGREVVHAGFARQDCASIVGDGLRHMVRWKGGAIGQFKGKAIRLRFLARMATIYAFQIR